MNDSHSTIKAFRAEWKINEKLSIDCYEFPDREKRIGITGASLAIGRSKEYLGRLSKRGAKALKSLQDKGYTGWQKSVKLITWDATVNKNPYRKILIFLLLPL